MNKTFYILSALAVIVGIYLWVTSDKSEKVEQPSGKMEGTGIYIGESSFCNERGCTEMKELLPENLLLVPPKEQLSSCSNIKKGWCAETVDTATATLLGFYPLLLKVRTISLNSLDKKP